VAATAYREPKTPTLITISDLGPDLILEIFLRLPSLSSLIRDSVSYLLFLTAVWSTPSFCPRFRALHPDPLLGFFS
jgi:hypothetical protein